MSVAVIGAGAFGTALAVTLAATGQSVTLVARENADAMQRDRTNAKRLVGVAFPDSLTVADRLPADGILLLALPTQQIAEWVEIHAKRLDGRDLILCCKGIDLKTGLSPATLVTKACPNAVVAVLTGPSFAADIGRGLPTALTLACTNTEAVARLQAALSTPTLRLYTTTDVTGAELGGALKNVVAIAAGIAEGAGLGESARAAVITRGFAELRRIAEAKGAEEVTLMGLSGLGDLTLTCTSPKSRNYAAGLALGRGETPDPNTTIEGLATADAVTTLGDSLGLDMPLARMVSAVASGNVTVQDAVADLLSRPLKQE